MAQYTDLLVYLDEIREARAGFFAAKAAYEESERRFRTAVQPTGGAATPERLAALLELCRRSDLGAYQVSRVFTALCLILFQPSAVFGGRIHLSLAKKISGAMGYNHTLIYHYRNQIETWLKSYADFRFLLRELYNEARII